MKIVFGILTVAAGICVLSVAATCIYRARYEKRISKRLAEGIPAGQPGKRMLAPFRFFWTCAVTLGIFGLILLLVASFSVTERSAPLRISPCGAKGITSMLDSREKISGYARHTAGNELFQFVYYVQDEAGDAAFPRVLIYVESNGEEDFSYQCQISNERNTRFSEARQGKSGWYAVDHAEGVDGFVFLCETSFGSGSVEVELR